MQKHNQQVFQDPRGRRKKVIGGTGSAVGLLAAVLLTLFVLSLIAVPVLPNSKILQHHKMPDAAQLGSLDRTTPNSARRALEREIAKSIRPRLPIASAKHIVAGFFNPWEAAALQSLYAESKNLTHVIPAWIRLNSDGSLNLDNYDPSATRQEGGPDVVRLARDNQIAILPLISNSRDDNWDEKEIHTLFASAAKSSQLADTLYTWVKTRSFQGINIDFENLDESDYAGYVRFLEFLHSRFSRSGLEVTADVATDWTPGFMRQVAAATDWVVLMAYDQHDETGTEGPIASISWIETLLDKTQDVIPTDKLVFGIGSYAYDWQRGKPHADALTFDEALSEASGYRDADPPTKVITTDPESLNATFVYLDDQNRPHDVWMLDAMSAFNSWKLAQRYGVRGAGVWDLGSEDPGIWKFLDRRAPHRTMDQRALTAVSFPYEVENTGRGEILRVTAHPAQGARDLHIDPSSGFIDSEVFQTYPSPYIVQHSGYSAKKLVLTFDDGPDPTYTPQVLDVLKRFHVPGTFFLVGRQAEANPDLVRRIYAEGHEIGSHTFFHPDMAVISRPRMGFELNATQRAIESITGHKTILFRPPFKADSEPSTEAEVAPLEFADSRNYVTVGEKVDPQDWDLSVPLEGGEVRAKTAQDIATSVVQQIQEARSANEDGNIILLHDAGGNRSQTVKALAMIIPTLHARGYQFVSTSDLMHMTRDQVMPEISTSERMTILVDRIVFGLTFGSQAVLAGLFVLAISLGIARVLIITPLALRYEHLNRRLIPPVDFQPSVAIAIAAFNEAAVVGRTIRAVLDSKYPIGKVVVVDDGSIDGTAEVILGAFSDDPRVSLLTQENQGKAVALNRALETIDAEVVVFCDADTQLDSMAVGNLVRHFSKPEVAAVAGNVKVGNAENLLTKWQAIEYITSQNLDRRAYALLNAITVVPGAIGAWRTSVVLEAGGFLSDTLAEDMDLTWRIRELGYQLETESDAVAYTEAPDTFRGFFRQRFRWAYGTLQCLWKHRSDLGRYGWFGWVALPALWIFQILFQAIAPLVDLQLLWSIGDYLNGWLQLRLNPTSEQSGLPVAAVERVAFFYGLLFAVELLGAVVAFMLDKERVRTVWWLFLQKFVYRQVMYGVIVKSILKAMRGSRQSWGTVERKGSVVVPITEKR